MYKLYESGPTKAIIHLADNAYIPYDENNTDYQAYLLWAAEGNEPLPADKGVEGV